MIELSKAKSVKTVMTSDAVLENIELRPIKDKLEEQGSTNISYFEIKLALAMIEKGDL